MRNIFILTFIFLFQFSFSQNKQKKILTIQGNEITVAELDEFIQKQMHKKKVPGLSIAIINNAKIVYQGVFGVQDLSTVQKVDEKTLFEAASLSKPLFAYFVMQQVEKGLLDLDKPLYEYLPYPDIAYDDRYKLLTGRMVLCHTSGFPNWRMADSLRLNFKPGDRYQYSGEAYQYLKSVLAEIRNTNDVGLDSIFYNEIALPIGAEHLYFTWNDYISEKKAMGHIKGKTTWKGPIPIPYFTPENFGSAYSLHTESNDFAKFLIEVMEPKILNQNTVDEMLTKASLYSDQKSRNPKEIGFSLGFEMDSTAQGIRYLHTGDNTGAKAYCHLYRDKKMGIVFMSNNDELYSSKFVRKLLKFLDEESQF